MSGISSSSRIICEGSSSARAALLNTSRSYASSSRSNPALNPTTAAAYEAALAYLSDHQSKCLSQLKQLQAIPGPSSAQRRAMEACEISAFVNDPDVRSEFRNTKGVGSMDRPVMRHLAERHWKKHGGLDLVMARVYQNKIVPDLLSDMAPTNPLNVTFENDVKVAPGSYLEPSQLARTPRITFQLFNHPSESTSTDPIPEGLYTLLVIDPDNPQPSTHSFSQRLQYLKTNLRLSVLSDQLDLMSAPGDELVSWEPPHPAQGAPTHRYVFFLLRQPSMVTLNAPSREHFIFRNYLDDRGVLPAAVVGVNLFKCEWSKTEDKYIRGAWAQYRQMEAPVYSKGRNESKYAYPMRVTEKKAQTIRMKAWEEALAKYAEVGLEASVLDAGAGELGPLERSMKRTSSDA